jgi:hypothetical protein
MKNYKYYKHKTNISKLKLTVGEKLKISSTVESITSKNVTLVVAMMSNIDIYFAYRFI